jgi:2-polyprenyl-3-methyl-5-hydroxy-6-metoxy-1,4-benzoquinol methylase
VKDDLNSRILEVGCGHGNLIPHLLDRDLVVGTDANTEAIAAVRSRYRDCSNLRSYVFDILSPPPDEILNHEIDTVISLNVLEHIEHDTVAVRNMVELLPTGGTLIIIVPAHGWLYGTMDSSIGHFRRYTKATMRHLLIEAGAEVTRQSYHNLFGAIGWWFFGRVLKCTNPPAGQLSLFDRLVPLLAVAERAIRPPFGLSLITVATA